MRTKGTKASTCNNFNDQKNNTIIEGDEEYTARTSDWPQDKNES